MTETTVYVVRDASGEYVAANGRTPASDEAREFDTRDEAEARRLGLYVEDN